MKHLFTCMIAGFFLTGCVTTQKSIQYPPIVNEAENGNISLQSGKDHIVLIYTPGSRYHNRTEVCTPEQINASKGVPNVLIDLTKSPINDKQIIIDGYCSPSFGNVNYQTATGKTMAEARVPDIEMRIQHYVSAGVPAKQIFVTGQSMGGMSALLVERNHKFDIGGVIAFAPGCCNTKARRTPVLEKIYNRLQKHLTEASGMNALVFSFYDDPYNPPEELQYLKQISRLDLIPLSSTEIGGIKCEFFAHHTFRSECFRQTQISKIRNFIEQKSLP